MRAETSRLLSRRFTGLALLVLLLGLGGYQLVVNESLSPLTGEQLAAAEQAYQQSHEDWVDNHEKYEQECRDTGSTAPDCTVPEPTLNDFSVEPTPFKHVASTALELSTVFVSLAAFLIAASFIGAEFNSGSISNWLTFVPRRAPVFWSKLLTMIGFAALLGASTAVLVVAAAVVLARFHNSATESLRELAETGARGVLVVVGLAVLGFCLGLVTRHTAGAIGVLLAFLVVSFVRIGPLSSLAWAQRVTPWTPEANLAAIVDRDYRYYLPLEKITPDGVNIEFAEHSVSLNHGITYWAILLLVVVAGSVLIFRRRDVA
ncbi:MAG TPA: ABC transporter permease subunit [Propionibacteriaceae bacterium]|nr:ABC transporter permease subunit [Propionibacteriaceae bacterium]